MKTLKSNPRINMPGEEWKPVVGYEKLYEVSNKGRVWSFRKKDYKVPWKTRKKYLEMSLFNKNHRKIFKVHRLVAIAFIPNPLNKPEVNHIRPIKHLNDVENLEWVTPWENMQHAVKLGLFKKKAA